MYNVPSLKNAQTSPREQYTLVSIRGRNSIPLPSGLPLPTSSGVFPFVEGKNDTNNCKRGKPARYAFSSMSMAKVSLDEGGLDWSVSEVKVQREMGTHS